jgi:hypothetical protein
MCKEAKKVVSLSKNQSIQFNWGKKTKANISIHCNNIIKVCISLKFGKDKTLHNK